MTSPLAVTVEWARQCTQRPRHLEAAIYHTREAERRGREAPPGCKLHLIPARGNQPLMLGIVSVLRTKDDWDCGLIPPLTPREEAAMSGSIHPIRQRKRKPQPKARRRPNWGDIIFTLLLSRHPSYRHMAGKPLSEINALCRQT